MELTLRDETLRRIVGTLPGREREILECRFGLDGRHPATLEELGHRFNVTRQRISQIERKSLIKLHHLARIVQQAE